MQTCWSLNSLFLGSILMLDCHHQICAGLIRIRKTPFKSSCSDPIFDVTEGFISTSIKFKPKRGILITSGIETFKFYLSSSLFLGHPCGKRKESSFLKLCYMNSELVECAARCLLTDTSPTELIHSKSLLPLPIMNFQC